MAIRVRRIAPVFSAVQWQPGVELDVPGLKVDDHLPGVTYVVTLHRQRWHLRPGDWLIWDDKGNHHKPMSDKEFRRHYEEA